MLCSGHVRVIAAPAGIDDPALLDGPLRTAAAAGNDTVVGVLLGSGANARSVNVQGVTPMGLACAGGHLRTMRLLLRWGVDFAGLGERGAW